MSNMILLGTRKGTVIFDRSNSPGVPGPSRMRAFLSVTRRVIRVTARLWASLDHGHWGPKLSRSRDGGATWEDVLSLKYPEGARYIVKVPADAGFRSGCAGRTAGIQGRNRIQDLESCVWQCRATRQAVCRHDPRRLVRQR